MGSQQESELGDHLGGPLPPSPLTTQEKQEKQNKKEGVGHCYYYFWTVLTHWQLHRWVWSWVVAVFCLAVVLHPAVVVEFTHPASVQGGSVYQPRSRDSPIPARNCWPVSSDVYVLDRHVRILYKFMFYIKPNTTWGWPTLGWPIDRPGVGRPKGVSSWPLSGLLKTIHSASA
jgi:hypothetical protein